MRTSLLVSLMLGLFPALPLLGQDGQNQRDVRQQAASFQYVFSLRGVELSKDQFAKTRETSQKVHAATRCHAT